MTTPSPASAAPSRRRARLALVGAVVGTLVSLGAISGSAAAGSKSITFSTGEVEMSLKSSGIRW